MRVEVLVKAVQQTLNLPVVGGDDQVCGTEVAPHQHVTRGCTVDRADTSEVLAAALVLHVGSAAGQTPWRGCVTVPRRTHPTVGVECAAVSQRTERVQLRTKHLGADPAVLPQSEQELSFVRLQGRVCHVRPQHCITGAGQPGLGVEVPRLHAVGDAQVPRLVEQVTNLFGRAWVECLLRLEAHALGKVHKVGAQSCGHTLELVGEQRNPCLVDVHAVLVHLHAHLLALVVQVP